MKRIAAGMMFAALAVVPVLCAQTFTNVAPPSGPPGWTNSTQPPPAWYAVLSYGTNGVVSGTYSNLQLNARGSNEIARLVAAGTNGGGSVIFTNTSAGSWRGDWGQSNANVLGTALTNSSFSINGMKVGRGSNLLITAGVSNVESAQSQLSITTNGGTRIINGPYFETEDDLIRALNDATNTFLPYFHYPSDVDPDQTVRKLYGVHDIHPYDGTTQVGWSIFGPDGTNYGKFSYSTEWGVVMKIFGEIFTSNAINHDQYAMLGIATNSGAASISGMVWRIQAGGLNVTNGSIRPEAFLILDYGNFPFPSLLHGDAAGITNASATALGTNVIRVGGGGNITITNNAGQVYISGNAGGGGSGADTNSVGLIATNAIIQSTNISARLASNVWAAADSTTNYMPRTGGTLSGPITNTAGFFGNGAGLTNLSVSGGGGAVTTNLYLDLPALGGPWNADSSYLGPTTNNAPAFQVLRPFTTSSTIRACAVNVAGTNTVQTRSFWGVMRLTASETNWASIAVEHLQTDATTTNHLSFSPLSQTNVLVSGTLTTGTNWIFSGTNFAGWREICVRCDTWHAAGAASTNWLPNIRSSRQ